MPALPTSTSSICSCVDPTVQITFDIANWDALSCLACKLYQVDSSHWGDRISGGYNLVRFLHLHDSENTTLVARVPLRSEDEVITEDTWKRIESEVATMDYVEHYTNIPVTYHMSITTVLILKETCIHLTFSCPKSKVCRSVRYGTTWMTTNAA